MPTGIYIGIDTGMSITSSGSRLTPQLPLFVKSYENTKAQVTLATYDGSGETIHPSVIAIPAGWNGYKYWMVNTPLPQSQASPSDYENPSIWASNDGVTWDIPAGLTNPIVAKPAGAFAYNADTDIFYNLVDNKLYVIWKNETFNTKMISSSDGVTWGDIKTVVTQIADETQIVSPSLIKIGSKFFIYYGYYLNDPSDLAHTGVRRVSCDTVDGTYGTREEITAPARTGYHWWHLGVIYYGGYYWMSANESTSNATGNIYILRSSDGITFIKYDYYSVRGLLPYETAGCYRSKLALIEGQWVLYYGANQSTPYSAHTVKMNINFLPLAPGSSAYVNYLLTDPSKTVGYFDFTDESTITKVAALVSKVNDQSGWGHHLLQAGADNIKPIWGVNGLTFDGVRQFMKAAAFMYGKPEFVFLLIKQITWTSDDILLDGNASNNMLLKQRTATPGLAYYAGAGYTAVSNDLAVGAWGIVRILSYAALSKFIINTNAPDTTNTGIADAGGITIGSAATGASQFGNFSIKAAYFGKQAFNAADEILLYNKLATLGGLATI